VYPADTADLVSRRDPHFMRYAAADRLMWQWVGMAVEGMAAEDMAAEGMAATGSATPRNLISNRLRCRQMLRTGERPSGAVSRHG
jgi:hypothetical protein